MKMQKYYVHDFVPDHLVKRPYGNPFPLSGADGSNFGNDKIDLRKNW